MTAPTEVAAHTVPVVFAIFPSWTFQVPVDVANLGFQIAIYGQDPTTLAWMYWDQSASAFVDFDPGTNGQDTTPLIDVAIPGSHDAPVSFSVKLPAGQYLGSGVVAMFVGDSSGIPVTFGVPGSPTTTTNPNDLYSIFEVTYAVPASSTTASLDIDISNVDQVGFTYTVRSSSAPFPFSLVGSTVPQSSVFSRFGTLFPAGTPFNECLVYGQQTIGGNVQQLRLLAPQDVLQEITFPDPPSYLAPTGAPTDPDPFADNTYFYQVSETSATGETAPNSVGVFGGYLLSSSGKAQAAGIDIGWLAGPNPGAYSPANASATGINLYRASGPPANAGSTPLPTPTTGYGLLTTMSIAEWNAQQGHLYLDDSTSVGAQTPKSSSYGFSALSTWFDVPLQQFFEHFASNEFALYQYNQNGGGSNGTLWTGKVVDVTPSAGDRVTGLEYVDEKGTAKRVEARWTSWADGTQTYKVLQLVGNAYDAADFSNTTLAGTSGLTQAEYQGAVVNVYFPYFTTNTGVTSIDLSGEGSYPLPPAPSWLSNATNVPSQMVFGCAGTFATINDPDALAQVSFPSLAERSLTNIENVIVSALNRGVATGYDFGLVPLGYACQYGFEQAPGATPGGTLAAGRYTYYLSGTHNDGSESALSWPQTIVLAEKSAVALAWLPQHAALYSQANVYRQAGTGQIELVGTVANSASSPAAAFSDVNGPLPPQPTNGAPFGFYPSWKDPSGPGFVNSNLFSAFLHQNLTADPTGGISINGLVYGYPFDDQGNFSTNINFGTEIPESITFAITNLG